MFHPEITSNKKLIAISGDWTNKTAKIADNSRRQVVARKAELALGSVPKLHRQSVDSLPMGATTLHFVLFPFCDFTLKVYFGLAIYSIFVPLLFKVSSIYNKGLYTLNVQQIEEHIYSSCPKELVLFFS